MKAELALSSGILAVETGLDFLASSANMPPETTEKVKQVAWLLFSIGAYYLSARTIITLRAHQEQVYPFMRVLPLWNIVVVSQLLDGKLSTLIINLFLWNASQYHGEIQLANNRECDLPPSHCSNGYMYKKSLLTEMHKRAEKTIDFDRNSPEVQAALRPLDNMGHTIPDDLENIIDHLIELQTSRVNVNVEALLPLLQKQLEIMNDLLGNLLKKDPSEVHQIDFEILASNFYPFFFQAMPTLLHAKSDKAPKEVSIDLIVLGTFTYHFFKAWEATNRVFLAYKLVQEKTDENSPSPKTESKQTPRAKTITESVFFSKLTGCEEPFLSMKKELWNPQSKEHASETLSDFALISEKAVREAQKHLRRFESQSEHEIRPVLEKLVTMTEQVNDYIKRLGKSGVPTKGGPHTGAVGAGAGAAREVKDGKKEV